MPRYAANRCNGKKIVQERLYKEMGKKRRSLAKTKPKKGDGKIRLDGGSGVGLSSSSSSSSSPSPLPMRGDQRNDRLLTHHPPPPPQAFRPAPIQRLRHIPNMLHAGLLSATGQALLGRSQLHAVTVLCEVRVLRIHNQLAGRAGFARVMRFGGRRGRHRCERARVLFRGRDARDLGVAAREGVLAAVSRSRGEHHHVRVGVDEGGGCGGGEAGFLAGALWLLGAREQGGGEFGVVGDALEHAFH